MAEKTLTLGTLFTANIKDALAKMGQLEAKMKMLTGAVTKTGTIGKKASKGITAIGTASEKAAAGTAKATVATKKLGTETAWMGKQISKVHGGINRLKAAMKVTASYGLAATAIFSVVRAMQAGVSEIVNYDQALKNLQAITGATNAEIAAMSDTLKNVARTTKFSTTETAEGMVLLGQAGFDAGESMDAMQAVANLATGTLSSMQLVTDLLTTTVRAFSMNALESSRVADVMANAINKSKLTIDKLRIAFSFVAATASQTGLTLEETAASMMTLANNGLRASTIGTGLRQVLSKLIAPNARLREAYEAHGIALDKVNPAVVGYQAALKNLSAVLWDSEKQTVDMSKAFELFQLRGAQAAAILIKSFVRGEFLDALDKVYEVGTAAAMAAKQQEGLGVQVKNLADRWKLFGLAIGEAGVAGGLGVLIKLAGLLGTGLEFIAKTIAGQVVIQFALWTGAIWLNITAVKALLTWIGTTGLIKYFKALRVEFILVQSAMVANTTTIKLLSMSLKTLLLDLKKAIVTHPILAIAAAAGAAATALYFLITATDRSIRKAQKQAVENERLVSSIQAYGGALESLHKRLEKGEDVGREYRATLKRLVAEHKDLAKAIDINVDSYERIIEVLEEFEIKRQEKALKDYSKVILENEKRIGSLKEFYDEFTEAAGMGAHSLDDLIKLFPKVARWADEINASFKSWISIQAEMVFSGKKTKESVADLIKEFFTSVEITERTTKALEILDKALQKLEDTAKLVGKEFREFLKAAPDDFQKFFAQLDSMRKVDFATAWKSLLSKKAAYIKSFKDLFQIQSQSAEEQKKLEAQLKTDLKAMEAEFWKTLFQNRKDAAQKEIDLWTERNSQIKPALESFKQEYDTFSESIADADIASFQKSVGMFQEKVENIIRLAEREAGEKLALIGLTNLPIKQQAELEEKIAKELKEQKIGYLEEWKKYLGVAYKEAISNAEEYKDKIEEYNAKIMELERTFAGFRMSLEEKLRDLRREGMTEEKAWLDRKLQATELLTKAQEEFAKGTEEGYKKGLELAGKSERQIDSLKGSIKEAGITEEKTVQEREKLYKQLFEVRQKGTEAYKTGLETLKAENEELLQQENDKIAFIERFKEMAIDAIETIKKNPLEIEITQAKDSLKDLTKHITTVRDLWEDWVPSVKIFKSYFEEHRNIITSEKSEESPIEKQAGGKFPGYGGGDKIRALLEAGEFVFRKEAVKGWGTDLLNWMNQMFSFREGGLANILERLQPSKVAIPKLPQLPMQTGGSVGQESLISGPLHTINLVINNVPHTVYAEGGMVEALEKTLRRHQLATA